MSWWDDAACLGADDSVFFNEGSGNYLYARKLCMSCPVLQECLTDVMRLESGGEQCRFGFRAGLAPKERAELSRAGRVNA